MKKIILKIVICAIAAVFIFAGGVWAGVSFNYLKEYLSTFQSNIIKGSSGEASLNSVLKDTTDKSVIKPIEEAFDLISGNSLTEKSREELLRAAIEGMLSILEDRYSEYFTAEEYQQIMESYSGTTSGIGVVVTLDEEGRVVVVRVLENAPASRTDIREGDIIAEVEGTDIKDMDLEKVVAMIKGKEGTDVNLKIYRTSTDNTFEVTVTRAEFDIPNLISDIFEEDIGYIWYYDFQISGADQLDKEIQKLINSGARGLILDLRNNPGGAWDDAVEVCDLFLDEGKIVSIKGRVENEERIEEYTASKGKYTEIPLVVLINGFSASASELVAGALKDNNRAVLIGERSYGKGVVQALYKLSDKSGIKFTTATYYLPSGVSVEGTGISPDITIELKPEDEEDIQLNRAIEEIKALISGIK